MNEWMNRQKPLAVEKYPKRPDDPNLPAQMELLSTKEGYKWAFRDVGLRVEVDGDVFVPDSTGPTEGYVVLRREGKDGIKASDEREVKIYADMNSDILALGETSVPRCRTEETITLCDHCGLSDDAGEIKEYVPRDAEGMQYGNLDLHKSCLDEFGVEVPEGPTFADAYQEATDEVFTAVLTYDKTGLQILGITSLIVGVPSVLALIEGFAVGYVGLGILAFVFTAVTYDAHGNTKKAVEELQ